MFTGIIERMGTLTQLQPRGAGARVVIAHAPWDEPLAASESVAVQGICLTVAEAGGGWFACDVLRETLQRTTLGDKQTGARLNLERALRANSRLGGHFVSGHVDGTGRVSRRESVGPDAMIEIACAPHLTVEIVEKGSIAIDGVSLTVTGETATHFQVHLIPFTLAHTTLGDLRPGATVNLETDLLAKYARKRLGADRCKAGGVQLADLERAGFF